MRGRLKNAFSDSNCTRSYGLSGPVFTLGGQTPFRTPLDGGAYHRARGRQQGRKAPQPGDPGRSRGEAGEALTASERTQSHEGRRRLEALAVDERHSLLPTGDN